MFDVLVRNALIVDGTGKPGYPGELAISGDKIVEIADKIEGDAKKVVDAQGHVVCPGFIDAHGHSDFTLFVNHRGESKIRQGITTEVTGNCGFTAGPITEKHEDDLIHYLANTIVLSNEQRADWNWKSQDDFLQYSARKGLSFNLVPLVGQGMIHVGVMGFEDRMAEANELEKMKKMLRTELEAGFFGMSVAFMYEPGNYIRLKEVVEMCKILREYDCIYTIHMKNEGMDLINSVRHAIEIGRLSGCKVEISHLKASFKTNWGKTKEALVLIEEAHSEGIDIGFDVYPYTAFGSGLIDLIPPWVKKDGPRIMLERLRDPKIRSKALYDMKHGIPSWDSIMASTGWEDCVQIASLHTTANKHYEGMVIGQIAKERDCTSYEAVVDLIIEENASIKCICFAMDEDELVSVMQHPMAIFATDGRACATYGELSKGAVHPRYYGTYPRIMGYYVREKNIFSLEEAIQKSTSAPARRFGIDGRGEICEGYYADLVIFSPDTITETSTFAKPHSYPTGIDYVIVNGKIVIEQDEHTGQLPGEILRKI